MKTTITLTVDKEAKKGAMPIIQNQMHTSLSHIINQKLWEILRKYQKEEETQN